MARDKGHLKHLQLRHWIKAGQPLAEADGDGHTFTLSSAGVAGWILRYRHGGRRRELLKHRSGPLPRHRPGRGARHRHPQARRGAAGPQPCGLETEGQGPRRARLDGACDLAKATLAKKLVSLAHSTQVSYGRHLKRVEKKLGALTVREIEASDVVALIEGAGLT
jgi:hypothetical protein